MYYLKQGDLSDFQPGSVTSTFHRCGNSGCHCPKPDDPGHGPHFQITGKIDGKTVTQSLPPLTPVQEDLPFAACRAGGTNAAGKKRAEETQCQVTEEGDRFLSLKWQPSGSYHVLATAYDDHALYDEKASDASNKQPMPGPGINEPMLWTTQYGNGRVFITALGHDGSSVAQFTFKATFTRGAEWLRQGKLRCRFPPNWPRINCEKADC